MPMAFAFLATRSARSIVFGVDMSRSFLIAVTMLAALVDAPNLDDAEETPEPRRLARGGKYR
jgi:hypothetical protein